MSQETGPVTALLLDAHVHLHDCFPPDAFLDHADRNFALAAQEHGWEPCPGGILMAEQAGVDWFGRLSAMAERGEGIGRWRVSRTADPTALWARSGDRRLVLVSGRQVATAEGLEVLLLGTRALMADGRPLREVLAEGGRLGALRIIPWGVGKWFFARGLLLRKVIDESGPGDGFFLGDSGIRPFFWPAPRHFSLAARRGVRVLPGTDPLPFPAHVKRPGGYGVRLEGPLDLTAPGQAITAALRRPEARLTPFGRRERLVPFVRDQFTMQRRKRRPA